MQQTVCGIVNRYEGLVLSFGIGEKGVGESGGEKYQIHYQQMVWK